MGNNLTDIVVDMGCGNGRNTNFMKNMGYQTVIPLDMAGDFGHKCVLGVDSIPLADNSANIILCNYILMFLSPQEREHTLNEIKRVASDDCIMMLELYPAKDSYAKTQEEMITMMEEIYDSFKWDKIRYAKAGGKFIIQNRRIQE